MKPADGSRAMVVLVRGDAEVILGRVCRHPVNLALVDALARLQLAARRRGCSIRLRNLCPELRRLLLLVGLHELVAGCSALRPDARRQTEGGEQLGVEEVVQPRDPPV